MEAETISDSLYFRLSFFWKAGVAVLLFSTILQINKKMTKEAFIRLVIEWNQKSNYPENIIPNLVWDGQYNTSYGTDSLLLDIKEYPKEHIVAVRYEKRDKEGVIWDSDYIMNFKDMKMSIRLDRSYLEEALKVDPEFSTPHFISMLIEGGYLKADNGLEVRRTPLIIDEDNLDIAVDIMTGKRRTRLPVVFVSKTSDNEDPIDVKALAGRLKGAAHVLVQGDYGTGAVLQESSGDEKLGNGGIDIYFPNPAVGHKRYIYRRNPGYDTQMTEEIIERVIQYSNAKRVSPLYVWAGVTGAIYETQYLKSKEAYAAADKERHEALYKLLALQGRYKETEKSMRDQAYAEAKLEADQLLESFDEENRSLREDNERLRCENVQLAYENQVLRSKLDSQSRVPVLLMGDEDDFYAGEIKDLLLKTLEASLNNLLATGTRRYDVVKDIIESNDYQRSSEKRAAEVKQMLNNYKGMTSKVQRGFEELGFQIQHDGGHYKTIYYGDDRYIIVHAATPSDGRAGKNNASDVIKKVF